MFDYYQLTVPVYTRALKQLAHILDKAAEYAAAKQITDETMLGLRLAPDMYNLTKQVQIVCDNAKFAVARLSGTQAPKHDDNEKSFAELQARIAATLRFVSSLPQAAFVDAGFIPRRLAVCRPSGRQSAVVELNKFSSNW